LLIEKSGGGEQQPVGRVVLHDLDEPVMPTNFAGRLRPAPMTDSRFACYLLASLYSDGRTRATIKQTTGIQNLDLDALLSFRVLRPNLGEQRAIADYLDAETARIDALIAKKRQMAELLAERAQVELSRLVIPNKCEMAHLRYFATIQSGITVDAGRSLGSDAMTRPYLRVANVQAGRLDLTEVTHIRVSAALAAHSTLHRNDVLMTEGGDIDKLGRGTVWDGELEDCLHQNHIFAVRPDSRRLDSWYLALITQSNHARVYFESTGVQSTNLASTSSTKILGLPVPVIPLQVQREIVAQWKQRSAHILAMRLSLTEQITLLDEHRQALTTAAVTGELDIAKVAA
jgi:type I restriction enzyme, S subunit